MTKPIDLGDFEDRARALIAGGSYETLEDVVEAGLAALEREDAAYTAWLKEKVDEALADPRPPVSIEEAFAEVRAAAERRR